MSDDRTRDDLLRELDELRSRKSQIEKDFLLSDQRFREALDNSRHILYRLNLVKGGYDYMSPCVNEILGYRLDHLIRRGLADLETFLHPDDRRRIAVEIAAAGDVREGDRVSRNFEYRIRKDDGTYCWLSDWSTMIFDHDGRITAFIGSAYDITGRKEAEATLKESSDRCRQLYESMRDAFVRVDLTGGILEFNEAYRAMLGYTPEELQKLTSIELTPEKWHAFEREIVEKQILARDHSDIYEKEYRRKDGTVFPVELRAFLLRDDAGAPASMWAIVRDVTERKEAEAAIQRERDQTQFYLDIAGVMLIALDAEGLITRINRKGCTILGYEEQEILGRNWFEVCLPKNLYCDDVMGVFRKLMAGEIAPVEYYENTVLTKSGEERIVAFHNTVLRDASSRIIGVFSSGEDVTDHRRAEAEKLKLMEQLQQAQKMESIGRLAGGVAHDFNNMLSVILGYAELMQVKLLRSDPLQADVQEIMNAAKRSRDITRQLLAFSRKQIIAPKVVDLNILVADTVKALARLIGEDIELQCHAGEDLGKIFIDPSQADQILMNLAVNARDAMPDGGTFTIETSNVLVDENYCREHLGFKPGRYVMMAVSDNGIGMDKETASHIFEPFFTTKELGKGTGLGLAMVYGIVSQNNGIINVYSEPGQGTTLKLYFPRYLEEETVSPEPAKKVFIPATGTVLLVEDDVMVRGMIQMMLERIGYTVLVAATPFDALLFAAKKDQLIDLLLTDVVMPMMSGKELRNRIVALRPGIKIVYMSGYTSNVIAHRGVLDDGVHFLEKPFSLDALARKIREAMDETR